MERNHFIDAIKGLLILLVIIGHCIQYGNGYSYLDRELYYNDFIFRSIYTFHMPMFMIVSGYLFRYSNKKSLGTVVLSKLKTIGVPFVVFCTIIYFIWWYCNDLDKIYISDYFRKMSINMWFLSSVIMNCIIAAIISHLFKDQFGWIAFALFILLFFVSDRIISAPHKYMYFFFFVGYYLNRKSSYISMMLEWMKKRYIFPFLTFLIVCIVYWYDDYMFIYKSGFCVIRDGGLSYKILLLDILRDLEALLCCCWFFLFIKLLKRYIQQTFILLLGNYTLSIYGFQSVFFSLIYEKKCPTFELFSYNIMPLILFAGALSFSLIFIRICLNYKALSILFLGKRNN